MELEDQLDALLAIAFGTHAEADVGLAFMAEQDEPLLVSYLPTRGDL
jgi:hypothetical protein